MALVEFVDSRGKEWRAWNITPEDMHPVTAREMFIGEAADFQEGWLVFESGGERRRLAPYPNGWSNFSPEGLETLLGRAVPVPTRPLPGVSARPTTGELRRFEDAGAPDEVVAQVPHRRQEDHPKEPRPEHRP